MMIADHQIILTQDHDDEGNAIMTKAAGAEKFSMEELVYDAAGTEESINTYGILPGSKYLSLPGIDTEGKVYISSSMAGKFDLDPGDSVHLKEKYGYGSYDFTVTDIVPYDGGIAVFMDNDSFNKTFGRDDGNYDGFFTDEPVTDIDEDYIAAEITSEDILKMAAQLDHSMGAYMSYFQYLCILLSAVLIFLLTKLS